jgi:hypothetical protein
LYTSRFRARQRRQASGQQDRHHDCKPSRLRRSGVKASVGFVFRQCRHRFAGLTSGSPTPLMEVHFPTGERVVCTTR